MAKTATQLHAPSYPKLVSPSGRYYIQCISTWSGDSVVWWSPNSNGYTSAIDSAGIYDEDEARRIEEIRSLEYAIPVELVEKAIVRHVTGSALDKVLRSV